MICASHLETIVSKLPDDYHVEDILKEVQTYFQFDYSDISQVFNNTRQLNICSIGKYVTQICLNYALMITTDRSDETYHSAMNRLCIAWANLTGQLHIPLPPTTPPVPPPPRSPPSCQPEEA